MRQFCIVRETYKKSVEKDVRKALLFPNNHMICSQFEKFTLKISQKATIHPFVSTKLYRTLNFTCSIQQRREKNEIHELLIVNFFVPLKAMGAIKSQLTRNRYSALIVGIWSDILKKVFFASIF